MKAALVNRELDNMVKAVAIDIVPFIGRVLSTPKKTEQEVPNERTIIRQLTGRFFGAYMNYFLRGMCRDYLPRPCPWLIAPLLGFIKYSYTGTAPALLGAFNTFAYECHTDIPILGIYTVPIIEGIEGALNEGYKTYKTDKSIARILGYCIKGFTRNALVSLASVGSNLCVYAPLSPIILSSTFDPFSTTAIHLVTGACVFYIYNSEKIDSYLETAYSYVEKYINGETSKTVHEKSR